jgi:hypothetical protein
MSKRPRKGPSVMRGPSPTIGDDHNAPRCPTWATMFRGRSGTSNYPSALGVGPPLEKPCRFGNSAFLPSPPACGDSGPGLQWVDSGGCRTRVGPRAIDVRVNPEEDCEVA